MMFRKAVLIIHGFAGGVYDEENLFYQLNSHLRLDVYNFTLPGHERNLSHDIDYQDWIQSTEQHIELLIDKGYRSIYVVGHSMGGLLATPAFQYLDEDTKLKDKVDTMLKNGPSIIKTYHAHEILSRILKVSVPMFLEFTKIVEKSQEWPSHVRVPTLIFQGLNDEIVPKTSSEFVYEQLLGKKWLVYVEDATHDLFKSSKENFINREIESFFLSSHYRASSIRKW